MITELRASIERSELARRLVTGVSWSIAGAVALSGLNLIAMIVVARLLGKEAFGQFVVLQSTLGMAGVFAGFGIGATATRYVAEFKSRDPEKVTRILALTERTVLIFAVIAALGLAFMSSTLATNVLNSPELTLPLSIATVSVFFSALDGYQKSVLIGLEAMQPLAVGSVLGTAVSIPAMLLSAHLFGLTGAAGGLIVSALIQCGISRFQMVDQLRRSAIGRVARQCSKEWRALRDFALPSLLGGTLVMPAHWACHAMLANTSNGYAELAVLGVAMQWFNVVIFLPSSSGRALLPVLTDRLAAGDHRQVAKLLKLAILANLAIAVPVALLIAAASPWIMAAYGSQFRDGWEALALIVAVAALVVAVIPIGHTLAAGNRMWLGVAMNVGWAAIYLSTALALVKFGAVGIVCSLGIAYLGHSVWVAIFTSTHLSHLKATKQLNNAALPH